MYRLRRQIFRQIVQKLRRNPVGFQAVFVRYGGKFASKLCIKAHAVIYSEAPYIPIRCRLAKKSCQKTTLPLFFTLITAQQRIR